MAGTSARDLIRALDRLLLWGAVILGAALIGLYVWLAGVEAPASTIPARLVGLTLAEIQEFIPLFVLFTATYLLFRKIDAFRADEERQALAAIVASRVRDSLAAELRGLTLFGEFYQVPWNTLLCQADNAWIVVHYFDSWVDFCVDGLRDFFARGGTLRLILPDPQNEDILKSIVQRFPEHDVTSLRRKVSQTVAKFRSVAERSGSSSARVVAMYVDVQPLYCAVMIDGTLVLSPYEHKRDLRLTAPAALFAPSSTGAVAEWFWKEWKHLESHAVRSEEL